MANKKISDLSELAEQPAGTDMVPVVDISDTSGASTGTTKKVSVTNLLAGSATGDITAVNITAGTGLTGSVNTTSGDHTQTLNVDVGIADTNVVKVDGASNAPVTGDYAKFTASGVEGREASEVLSDIGAAASGHTHTNAAFLNVDQAWTGSQRATPVAVTPSANVATFDLDSGQNFTCTTDSGASTEITFSNLTTGQSGFIKLTIPSATSSAVTLNTIVKSPGGTGATDLSVLDKTHLVSYLTDGTNVYLTYGLSMA